MREYESILGLGILQPCLMDLRDRLQETLGAATLRWACVGRTAGAI